MQPPPSIPSLPVSARLDREATVTANNRGRRGGLTSPVLRCHPNTQVIQPQDSHCIRGCLDKVELCWWQVGIEERITPSQEGGQFLGWVLQRRSMLAKEERLLSESMCAIGNRPGVEHEKIPQLSKKSGFVYLETLHKHKLDICSIFL